MRIRFSPLLATGAQTMVPTLMLFSVYLLVVGHDVPGGGFAGGLIASSALLLVFLTFGEGDCAGPFPIDPETAMGVGLVLAIAAGVVGLAFGEPSSPTSTRSGPSRSSATSRCRPCSLFDVGVYIVVVGLVTTAIFKLGSDPMTGPSPSRPESSSAPAPTSSFNGS